LVLDNKKRINTDSYLKDELTEAHDAQNQYPSGKPPGLIQHFPFDCRETHPCLEKGMRSSEGGPFDVF
jgi:hypothetical protein